VTKSLIKSLVYEPEHLDKIIYELIYDHKNSDSMILSSMIKTYDVDVNIMFAKTLELRDETIGYLYLEIRGDKRDEALAYLHHQGIEVRRYV
jgi:D-methionine transport system ATP-binding protein